MKYKLASLFDGSGGFPLGGILCDIEPVLASEVEPYPIAVTRSRIPSMKHLGDVSKINGAEIEPVDVLTFGAPCQDLSVAGKRKGLRHESLGDEETTRSGLFMEPVRIAKEMREKTNGRYPKVLVYENVPGALSSSAGEDWRTVLQSLIQIVEPTATMPPVPKGGWPYADHYCGDGWSLAYRILDSQYLRTAQRRRRLYLILDLRGERAGKILFERDRLRRNYTACGAAWEAVAGDAADRLGADDREGEVTDEAGGGRDAVSILTPWDSQGNQVADGTGDHVYPTLRGCGGAGYQQGYVLAAQEAIPYTLKIRSGCEGGGKGALVQEDKSATLATNNDQYLFQPVTYAIDQQGGKGSANYAEEVMPTLCSDSHGTPHAVAQPVGCDLYNLAVSGDKAVSLTTAWNSTGSGPTVAVPLADVASTLRAGAGAPKHEQDFVGRLVVEQQPIAFAQNQRDEVRDLGDKAGALQAEPGMKQQTFVAIPNLLLDDQGGSQITVRTDGKSPTLRAEAHGNQPAVVFSVENHPAYSMKSIARNGVPLVEQTNPICASDYKDPDIVAYPASVAVEQPIALDRAFFNQGQNALYDPQFYTDGTVPTLVARGPAAVAVRYIVRRLTPTECARLQGFPDKWGHPDRKDSLTNEEAEFWREVHLTDCAINGKKPKPKIAEKRTGWESATCDWYNKLHTDSAEYKMWGNGVALPCILYVMQGIKDALDAYRREEIERCLL